MSTFARWCRFNLVGALGAVVQLGTLKVLLRCAPLRYSLCAFFAIELTLLHNFLWHWHFTWRDRRGEASAWWRWGRFQCSNGLVSLLGNLLIMRWLVACAHAPVLVANGVAVVCCAVANFGLSRVWAFRPVPERYRFAKTSM